MGVKNIPACSTASGNTGVKTCWNDVGIPRAILFAPLGKIYPTTSVTALITAIQADILADDPELRIYPIQGIEQTEDKTKDPNEQTFTGTGKTVVVGENDYDMSYQWVDGGFCLLHSLRTSRGRKRGFFIIDSFGQLIGVDAGTTAQPEQITPISGYNYTNPMKWATTNSAVAAYMTRLVWSPEQTNDNIGLVNFNNEDAGGLGFLETLNGLFDIHVSQGAARAAGVFIVKAALSGCGNKDLYDQFDTAFATTGVWLVRNKATKNPVAVTALATSPINRGWQVTASTSDPNYTATVGGLEVYMARPTELNALISGSTSDGFESDYLAQ